MLPPAHRVIRTALISATVLVLAACGGSSDDSTASVAPDSSVAATTSVAPTASVRAPRSVLRAMLTGTCSTVSLLKLAASMVTR